MIETKMERAIDDNNRCTEDYKLGRCPYKPVPHGTKCIMHGGVYEEINYEKAEIFKYRAARWESQINHFADNEGAKSLRQEIGVSRMILEEVLLKCKDSTDLLLYSTKIINLISQIEKLVLSCTKLEDRLGIVLDKGTILNLASQIGQILAEFVPEDQLLEASNRIEAAILDAGRTPMAIEQS